MGRQGVMICGHGSRSVSACREFESLVQRLAVAVPGRPTGFGYLEFARPTIGEGLARLRAMEVDDVLAVPGMLFAAGHVKNDVPSVLNEHAARHGIRIRMGRDLGIDSRLLMAARDRLQTAIASGRSDVPVDETCLVVIGRGTSDSDANGNVAKVARMLWEGLGFGHAEIGYSGVTYPRTDLAIERAARLGFRRLVVFPYFLFTGVLVERIYAAAERFARDHPDIELLRAGYLSDHPLVVETFLDRIAGIEAGDAAMNCSLCKYRTAIIGHEDAVGAPQTAHHHHVEGIGTGHHGHEHAHGHGDHHHGHDGGHGHAHGPHDHHHGDVADGHRHHHHGNGKAG